MKIVRSEFFEADEEHQFRWYLLKSGSDPALALELAGRFADMVDDTLDFLVENPTVGRHRFVRFSDLKDIRSFPVGKPFQRFLVYYRIEYQTLFAERLIEGHRFLASNPK